MIIVYQDKTGIINFDKVQNIYVSGRFISLYFELNNNKVIGTYKTEERAKEVLKEILEAYKNCNYYSLSQMGKGFVINDYYEMPEE